MGRSNNAFIFYYYLCLLEVSLLPPPEELSKDTYMQKVLVVYKYGKKYLFGLGTTNNPIELEIYTYTKKNIAWWEVG